MDRMVFRRGRCRCPPLWRPVLLVCELRRARYRQEAWTPCLPTMSSSVRESASRAGSPFENVLLCVLRSPDRISSVTTVFPTPLSLDTGDWTTCLDLLWRFHVRYSRHSGKRPGLCRCPTRATVGSPVRQGSVRRRRRLGVLSGLGCGSRWKWRWRALLMACIALVRMLA